MPFTILRQPTSPAPVRSPARFVLKDLEYLQQAGVNSSWSITFTSVSTVGDTLAIAYADVSILFTCDATLLTNGASFTAGASAAFAALNFYNGALLNYFFTRDFVITRTGDTVTFTAKNTGAQYDPALVSAGGALTVTHLLSTGGASRVYRAQHHVGLAVWVEEENGTDVYTRLPDQAGYPRNDSIVEFDISTWLRPFLDPDPVPYALNTAMPAAASVKRYYLQYWSRYATALGEQPIKAIHATGAARAWLAGYPREEYTRFNAWTASAFANPGKFLTWRGRSARREVTKQEVHVLNWRNGYTSGVNPTPDPFELQVMVTFNSGLATGWLTRITTPYADIEDNPITIWPTGWTALDLDAVLTDAALDPAEAAAYSVRIRYTGNGTVVSEEYTFNLVAPDYQEVHVQFFSSLGAWESVRFTGAWQRTLDEEYQPLSYALGYMDDGATTPGREQAENTGGMEKLLVNSGIHAIAEHRALLDILKSPAIRQVDIAHSRFLPLHIAEATDVPVEGLGSEEEHANQLSITFLRGDPGTTVSEIP